MTAPEALRILFVAAVFVVTAVVVWVEPMLACRRAKGLAEQKDAAWQRYRAHLQSALEAATAQQAEQVQTTLDAAFEQATEQYHAGLELGQGGRMPSREQVAAQYALITEEHDRIPLTTGELLAFAALAAGFERAFRPPIAAEPTDPDGSPHAW